MTKPVIFENIPFLALHISSANMREGSDTPDISDILPSVRERGIQQPIIVRAEPREDKKGQATYGIVAGRRRFNCLIALQMEAEQDETDETFNPLVPCVIIEADDDAAALEISLLENFARTDATPMQEYKTFFALSKQGQKPEDIAATFGLTPAQVKQRLALGNLLPPIQNWFESGELDAPSVQALTMATKKQQREWVKIAKDKEQRTPTGKALRAWLSGGGVITTDAALFDVSTYKGKILTDLFGENGQFACVKTFWQAQSAAVAKREAAYLADGWSGVELITGWFSKWSYSEVSKDEGGRVYIVADQDSGEIEFHEGLLHDDEVRKLRARQAKAKAKDSGEVVKAAPKPEMSGPQVNYMDLHKHSVARFALLSRPDLAARLIVAHMVCGSSYFKMEADPRRAQKEATHASAAANLAEIALTAERDALAPLLGFKASEKRIFSEWSDKLSTASVFAKCLELDDETITRLQTFLMCEALSVGTGLIDAVGSLCGADMNEHWTPDDAFFDIMRDKGVIRAMITDAASKAVADAHATATAKVQKATLRDYVNGSETRKPNPDFRVRWAAFPSVPYRKIDGCPPALNWKRMKAAFKGLIPAK